MAIAVTNRGITTPNADLKCWAIWAPAKHLGSSARQNFLFLTLKCFPPFFKWMVQSDRYLDGAVRVKKKVAPRAPLLLPLSSSKPFGHGTPIRKSNYQVLDYRTFQTQSWASVKTCPNSLTASHNPFLKKKRLLYIFPPLSFCFLSRPIRQHTGDLLTLTFATLLNISSRMTHWLFSCLTHPLRGDHASHKNPTLWAFNQSQASNWIPTSKAGSWNN